MEVAPKGSNHFLPGVANSSQVNVPTGWTEDSAMKVRNCLSAFLFTIFLCAFFYVPRKARAATPATPPQQSQRTQSPTPAASVSSSPEEVTIPRPLRSFVRMAPISQNVSPEEVLPPLPRHSGANNVQGGSLNPQHC